MREPGFKTRIEHVIQRVETQAGNISLLNARDVQWPNEAVEHREDDVVIGNQGLVIGVGLTPSCSITNLVVLLEPEGALFFGQDICHHVGQV